MGQKTNPIGNRLGIIRGWDSNWFGGNDYGDRITKTTKSEDTLKLDYLKVVSLESTLREP